LTCPLCSFVSHLLGKTSNSFPPLYVISFSNISWGLSYNIVGLSYDIHNSKSSWWKDMFQNIKCVYFFGWGSSGEDNTLFIDDKKNISQTLKEEYYNIYDMHMKVCCLNETLVIR